MKAIVRGFGDGNLIFSDEIDDALAITHETVIQHLRRVTSYEKYTIEIEFPDLPVSTRFLRFGNDPRQMVQPIQIRIGGD